MSIASRLGLFAAVVGVLPATAAIRGGSIVDEAAEDRQMTHRRGMSSEPLVDYLYTYGAPSVAKRITNPGGKCSEFRDSVHPAGAALLFVAIYDCQARPNWLAASFLEACQRNMLEISSDLWMTNS